MKAKAQKLGMALALSLMCVPLSCAMGSTASNEAPPTLPAVPDELAPQVAEALEKAVEAELDVTAICRQLHIPYPPTPVTRRPAAIEKQIRGMISQAVAKKVEKNARKLYEAEARETYPLCAEGDDVTAELTRGGKYQGRLSANTPGRLRIGGKWVSKIDLTPTSLSALDETANREARETYVRRRLAKDRLRADAIARDLRGSVEQRLYEDSGYVSWKGHWTAQEDLLRRAMAWHRKRLAEKLNERVTRAVMSSNDYFAVEGQWLKVVLKEEPPPTPVVAALRDAAKEEKRQRKTEKPEESSRSAGSWAWGNREDPQDDDESEPAPKPTKSSSSDYPHASTAGTDVVSDVDSDRRTVLSVFAVVLGGIFTTVRRALKWAK